MLDFPSVFPDNAFGVAIRDTPDGWEVRVYRSVHLLLLENNGFTLIPDVDYVVACRFNWLTNAIDYVHGSGPAEAYNRMWGVPE